MASYGFLGLLGGLGQAAQTVGGALFSEGIDRRREERLQAYQDRVYDRARKDAVADMDRSEAFQTAQQQALFGQQKSMAKLEFAQRKDLEKYIRENFAQSKLGRQYADLERYRMILTLASSLTSTSAWIERLRYKSSSLFLTAILWATRDTAYPYATRKVTSRASNNSISPNRVGW